MEKKSYDMNQRLLWGPAVLLGIGAVLTLGPDTQRSLSLRVPLETAISRSMEGFVGSNIQMADWEVRAAAPTEYLMRNYELPEEHDEAVPWFSLYVGYYERQTQRTTAHSPKNCLPGSGWDPLASEVVTIQTAEGPVAVNRYTLQREGEEALVLYWYQGRGRTEANEYIVKWNLLWDAVFKQRSDEALVRIVVPNAGDPAFNVASSVASRVVTELNSALPD